MTKQLQNQTVKESEKKSTCIINTGVPHSGKGVISGVLHHLGVNTGRHKEIKEIYHPHNEYEELFFTDLHVQITSTRVEHFGAIHKYLSEGKVWNYTEAQRETIKQLIIRNSNKASLWSIQDVRLCIPNLFDNLLPIIEEIAEPALIIGDRDLVCTAENYLQYYEDEGIDYIMKALMGYQTERNRIFQEFTGKKIIISFEDSIFYPKKTVGKIADFIDVDVTNEAHNFLIQRADYLKDPQCIFPEAKKYKHLP